MSVFLIECSPRNRDNQTDVARSLQKIMAGIPFFSKFFDRRIISSEMMNYVFSITRQI
jgi:hypothetical protein